MDPAVRGLVDHLSGRGVACMTGLDHVVLTALERELDGTLPDATRALYRACGGMGDPYTHWRQAVLALIAVRADDAVAAQRVDKPGNWPVPS